MENSAALKHKHKRAIGITAGLRLLSAASDIINKFRDHKASTKTITAANDALLAARPQKSEDMANAATAIVTAILNAAFRACYKVRLAACHRAPTRLGPQGGLVTNARRHTNQ